MRSKHSVPSACRWRAPRLARRSSTMPQMATPGCEELLLKAGADAAPTFKSSFALGQLLRHFGAPPNGSWSSSPCSCRNPGGTASAPCGFRSPVLQVLCRTSLESLVVRPWSVPLFRRVTPTSVSPSMAECPTNISSERGAK